MVDPRSDCSPPRPLRAAVTNAKAALINTRFAHQLMEKIVTNSISDQYCDDVGMLQYCDDVGHFGSSLLFAYRSAHPAASAQSDARPTDHLS